MTDLSGMTALRNQTTPIYSKAAQKISSKNNNHFLVFSNLKKSN